MMTRIDRSQSIELSFGRAIFEDIHRHWRTITVIFTDELQCLCFRTMGDFFFNEFRFVFESIPTLSTAAAIQPVDGIERYSARNFFRVFKS